MLFTALPLTLALCSEANAIGSDASKARKSICDEIKTIKDKNDPRLRLKPFCKGSTLHCTTHARGGIGILGKVEGVCDDPELCTNTLIYDTCKKQCLDERTDKFGINDKKTEEIKKKIAACQTKFGSLGTKTPQSTGSSPQPTPQPPKNTPPQYIPPPLDTPPPPPQMDVPPPPLDTPPPPQMDVPPPPLDIVPPPPPLDIVPPPPLDIVPPPPQMDVPPPSTNSENQQPSLLDQIRNNNKVLKNSNDRKLNDKKEDEESPDITTALQKAIEGKTFDTPENLDSTLSPEEQEQINKEWE